MKMNVYLSFDGSCEEAFHLYERCLGARLVGLFRYEGSELAGQVPAEWGQKVMHATLELGDQVLMGGDVAPGTYEAPSGFTLNLQLDDIGEAERIFKDLSERGRVTMPLQKTFWAARFGMFVDRFGIPWQINCEDAEEEDRE